MITRHIGFAVAYAAILLTVSLSLAFADSQGWVGTGLPDRIIGIMIGITVAVFANPVAKRLPGAPGPETNRPGHAAFQRFTGLVMVLAGIGYALVWVVAPVGLAPWMAVSVVMLGFVIILARRVFAGSGKSGPSSVE